MGQQQCLRAHAGRGQGGLGTGMATTNDNDVETGRKIHRITSKAGKKSAGQYTCKCNGFAVSVGKF